MKKNPAILGAAFLMATSAIGPGFLNNTSLFTKELLTSFGFVILVSILLDIGAQLNIWRIVTVSGIRAQDLSNKLLPGLGYVLAFLVAFGGLYICLLAPFGRRRQARRAESAAFIWVSSADLALESVGEWLWRAR